MPNWVFDTNEEERDYWAKQNIMVTEIYDNEETKKRIVISKKYDDIDYKINILNFGKYKGKSLYEITKIDINYILWLSKNVTRESINNDDLYISLLKLTIEIKNAK